MDKDPVVPSLILDTAFLPGEARKWLDRVCILVDVISATSTMVAMFEAGAARIIPAGSVDEARRIASDSSAVLVGEDEHFVKPPGFRFTNSPTEFVGTDLSLQTVVFCSANGTKAMGAFGRQNDVFFGGLRNAAACAREALAIAVTRGVPIGIVCSGFAGSFAIDDAYCAGYLGTAICQSARSIGQTIAPTETAAAAMALCRGFTNPREALLLSESGKLIEKLGLADELDYCSAPDVSPIVPRLFWSIGEGGSVHREILICEGVV